MDDLGIALGWMIFVALDPFALLGFLCAALRIRRASYAIALAVAWSLAVHLAELTVIFVRPVYPYAIYQRTLLIGALDAVIITGVLYAVIARRRTRHAQG